MSLSLDEAQIWTLRNTWNIKYSVHLWKPSFQEKQEHCFLNHFIPSLRYLRSKCVSELLDNWVSFYVDFDKEYRINLTLKSKYSCQWQHNIIISFPYLENSPLCESWERPHVLDMHEKPDTQYPFLMAPGDCIKDKGCTVKFEFQINSKLFSQPKCETNIAWYVLILKIFHCLSAIPT